MTLEPREPGDGLSTAPDGRGPTRRKALTVIGGTAAAIGVGLSSNAMIAGAAQSDDVAPEISFAIFAVGLELAVAEMYQDFAKASAQDAPAASLATACAQSHTAQAKALGSMISAAGAEVPTVANSAFAKQFDTKGPSGDSKASALQFVTIENSFAATYLDGLSKITSSSLAMIAAQILATDAAQAVAWSAVAQSTDGKLGTPAPSALPQTQTTDAKFTPSSMPNPTTTVAGA